MESKERKGTWYQPFTPRWFAAWQRMATNEVVIRASLVGEARVNRIVARVLFIQEKPNRQEFERLFCLLECRRTVGREISLPKSKLTVSGGAVEEFLTELGDQLSYQYGLRGAEVMLRVKRQTTILNPFGTKDWFLVAPSHPLAMFAYGALYELISWGKDHKLEEESEGIPPEVRQLLWTTLESRYKAFLHRYQGRAIEHTLGEVVL